MEEILVVVLLIAVVYLLFRQSTLAESLPRIQELTELIRTLERRLSVLEQTPKPQIPVAEKPKAAEAPPLAAAPNPGPKPAVAYQPLPSVQASRSNAAAPPPTLPVAEFLKPITPPTPSDPPPPRVSFEERLGRNWLNKLGITTLVIGLALFLGYQLRTLGPLGKSLLGLALSALLLAGGILLERRERYRVFARAAIGGGWGLTFFVSFALYHVDAMRILHSQAADLILMFLVAAAMVGHSLRYQSQVVTTLAFSLAFVTVGLSQVTLFSLVAGALLASGLVFVAARERWFELGLAGVLALYFNHFLWLSSVLPEGGRPGIAFRDSFPASRSCCSTGCSSASSSYSASRSTAARSSSPRLPPSPTPPGCCSC